VGELILILSTPKQAAKYNLFQSAKLFPKMPGKNTTEVIRKHVRTKKVRIRA
jgi:hypothetical protein